MPPLECANFLECENKTVCVAPFGSLRPSFFNPSFFHHIPENYHNSPCWVFFYFFCQNGLECDSMWNYRRLTRKLHLPHIPENVIPGDFSQKQRKKKAKKKRKKRKKHGVRRFYGVRRSCRVREFYSMYTSLAVECDVPCGVRRNYGMRRIPGIETTEVSGPEPKFQSQSQPKLPGAHQLVGSVFPSSPWVRPRGRNWLIFIQPTFKNVTFDNPVLLR